MDLTLAHDLLLLSLDPETGARRRRQNMHYALGGALLAELALAGRVDVDDKRVAVVDPGPTGLAAADELLARLMTESPRTPKRWVEKLRGKLDAGLLADLVRAELVARREHRILGLVPDARYPQISGARRDELLGTLRGLLIEGAAPSDPRSVALADLVVATDLAGTVFPGESKRALKKRLTELDEAGWASEGVRKAIAAASTAAGGGAVAGVAATS